jgi:hypothetical protein
MMADMSLKATGLSGGLLFRNFAGVSLPDKISFAIYESHSYK